MSTKRKELKNNDLAEALEGGLGDLKPHLNTIAFGAVAVVAVALTIFFVMNYFKTKGEQQWGDFFIAQNNALVSANSKELENISETHPGTEPEAWARQLVADKQLSEALRTLFANREEGQDELKDAIDEYNWILDESGYAKNESMLRRAALMGRAQAYEGLFEKDKAIADFKLVVSEYAETPFSEHAQDRIDLLNRVDVKGLKEAFNSFDPSDTSTQVPQNFDSLPPIPNISFPKSISDIGNQGTTEGLVPAGDGTPGNEETDSGSPPLQIPGVDNPATNDGGSGDTTSDDATSDDTTSDDTTSDDTTSDDTTGDDTTGDDTTGDDTTGDDTTGDDTTGDDTTGDDQ